MVRQVKLYDGSALLAELAGESEPTAATAKGKPGRERPMVCAWAR
jgi:hypothetical protein